MPQFISDASRRRVNMAESGELIPDYIIPEEEED
jgi:hypothetical protein